MNLNISVNEKFYVTFVVFYVQSQIQKGYNVTKQNKTIYCISYEMYRK